MRVTLREAAGASVGNPQKQRSSSGERGRRERAGANAGVVENHHPTFRCSMRCRSIRGSGGVAPHGVPGSEADRGAYVPCPGPKPGPALLHGDAGRPGDTSRRRLAAVDGPPGRERSTTMLAGQSRKTLCRSRIAGPFTTSRRSTASRRRARGAGHCRCTARRCPCSDPSPGERRFGRTCCTRCGPLLSPPARGTPRSRQPAGRPRARPDPTGALRQAYPAGHRREAPQRLRALRQPLARRGRGRSGRQRGRWASRQAAGRPIARRPGRTENPWAMRISISSASSSWMACSSAAAVRTTESLRV
jgi:hypothetical protein